MSETELREEAEQLFEDWHEDQFECGPIPKGSDSEAQYHHSFVRTAFRDAFVLGVECGANASPDQT